jgi:hypothetical protein
MVSGQGQGMIFFVGCRTRKIVLYIWARKVCATRKMKKTLSRELGLPQQCHPTIVRVREQQTTAKGSKRTTDHYSRCDRITSARNACPEKQAAIWTISIDGIWYIFLDLDLDPNSFNALGVLQVCYRSRKKLE